MSKAVTYSRHNGDVVCVQRGGVEYSEAHMGFGEGRTQSLVVALEKLPKKSLILVEEPETSLHPGAQYALAKYLMDVSIRRVGLIRFGGHLPKGEYDVDHGGHEGQAGAAELHG